MPIALGNCSTCCGSLGGNQEQNVFAAVRYTSIGFWFGGPGSGVLLFPSKLATVPQQVYMRWDTVAKFNGQIISGEWQQSDPNGNFTAGTLPTINPASLSPTGLLTPTTPPTPDTINWEFDGYGQIISFLRTAYLVEGIITTQTTLSMPYTIYEAAAKAVALLGQVQLLNPNAQYKLGTGQTVALAYVNQATGQNLATNNIIVSNLPDGSIAMVSPTFGDISNNAVSVNDYPDDAEYGTYTASAGINHQTNNINVQFDGNLWAWKRAVRHLAEFTSRGDTLWVAAGPDNDTPVPNGGLLQRAGQPRTNLNPVMLPGEDILDPDLGQPGFRSWG